MALYSFTCPSCHAEFDVYKSMERMDEDQECTRCGATAQRHWLSRSHIGIPRAEQTELRYTGKRPGRVRL